MYKFPDNFYWGTATSSHQVEGNNKNNDWWRSEQEGSIKHKSGRACDSYNRYEEDFDLAKELGTNAHRFSIEWSRIEPEEGKFSEEAIEHYRKVIRALRKRGLEPFVTLHHFTNPIWFADKGGWENKKAPEYFARYVEHVIGELGDEANYWITINEPLIYSMLCYSWGVFPPHKKSWISFIRVARNMVKAHKGAYRIIKEQNSEAQIGLAKNNNYFEPYKNQPPSRVVAFFVDYVWNKWFLNKINKEQDFVGINHYNRNRIHVRFSNPMQWFNQNENKEVSDFGWEIYPESIYHVVKQAWEAYKKPVYIFENGIADADDNQ
ncbi:MAG: family 1 glycosylhydrolase, partial [Candidatus Spechtbacterales bacterium]